VEAHFEGLSVFMKRSKREGYREMLSTPRLRQKFTDRLAHFSDFDDQYRVPIPSNMMSPENIALELKKRHSPDVVFAISELSSINYRQIALTEALKEVVGRGMGTVLCCIPGRLIYIETEDERFVLERR
jgi:hypothetical protein